MDKNYLFTATVSAVYPAGLSQTVGGKQTIIRKPYTIDAVPQALGRQMYANVSVIKAASGGAKGGSGFVWMPDVGDLVVCGFIDGNDILPVCFGAVINPNTQIVSPQGNAINDCTFHHITGSFIRMRGTDSSSEIEINHNSGAVIRIATDGEITIRTNKDVTISDANANINCSGDATIKALGTVQLSAPKVELGAAATEHLIKGDLFQTFFDSHTHPTGVGPSGTPIPQMATRADLLSTISTTE